MQFHTEEIPIHTALEAYNFPKTFKDTLRTFNLKDVYSKLIKKPEDETEAEGVKQSEETSTGDSELAADTTDSIAEESISAPSGETTGEAVDVENGNQETTEGSSSKMEVEDETKIEPLLGKDEKDFKSSQAQKRKMKVYNFILSFFFWGGGGGEEGRGRHIS